MDREAIVNLLKGTLDPKKQKDATSELEKLKNKDGFGPSVLQVSMENEYNLAERQAAVIYVKNLIESSWAIKEQYPEALDSNCVTLAIAEADKTVIRENIIEAVIIAPEAIRKQLSVCLSTIIEHDFPQRWPDFGEKINTHLQNPDPQSWLGALRIIYQLAKVYEYKNKQQRVGFSEIMKLYYPQMYEKAVQSLDDQVEEAPMIRKTIVKTYFVLTNLILPIDLLKKEVFTKWTDLFCTILEKEVPEKVQMDLEDDEKPSLIWWKEKKWAMRILARIFERYGSPENVSREYKMFSEWYISRLSSKILKTIFKLLNDYKDGVYVSPKVMMHALSYLDNGIPQGPTWKVLQTKILDIIKNVLLPLMSYTEEDEELWDTDPYEFITVKYGVCEDNTSLGNEAQSLLHSVCKERSDVLLKTVDLLMSILQDSDNTTPSKKDGALQMIGSIAELLLKSKSYKDKMEQFLEAIVFPELSSTHGHLRARSCWILQHFADVKYKNTKVLEKSFRMTIDTLLKKDEEVPVRVQAAVALQKMLTSQGDGAKAIVADTIGDVTIELLDIIRDTGNDELIESLQTIVATYGEELAPVIKDVCQHIVETFTELLESNESNEENKAMTSMSLLNALQTILGVMEDKKEARAEVEPIISQAVRPIFTNSMTQFFEEALSITCDLTSLNISSEMWEVLDEIYDAFKHEGAEYFTDMAPVLYNYITVDTKKFLSNPKYIRVVYEMCKTVLLESDLDEEEPECYAAKILEVIILQCKGNNIDEIIPLILDVVFARMKNRYFKSTELRIMCLLVCIAAMYYNRSLFIDILKKKSELSETNQDSNCIMKDFLNQWIYDLRNFTGTHNRKMCILGLCQLMTMPNIPGVTDYIGKIVPGLLQLFGGMKPSDSSETNNQDTEDIESECDDEWSDEEDGIDDSNEEENDECSDEDPDESNNDEHNDSIPSDEEDIYDESGLDEYLTPLDGKDSSVDEYKVFRSVIKGIEDQNASWYKKLIAPLSENDKKTLKEAISIADQRNSSTNDKSNDSNGFQFIQSVLKDFKISSR